MKGGKMSYREQENKSEDLVRHT